MKTVETTAEDILADIVGHLESGGVVVIASAYHAWQYEKKHVASFRINRGSVEFKSGRSWYPLTIKGRPILGIRFGRYK